MRLRFGNIPAALLLFAVATGLAVRANDNASSRTETESYKRVAEEIRFLASDELEGRGPGTKGIDRAAEYIRDEFRRLGYKSGTKDGTYYQTFPLSLGLQLIPGETELVLTGPAGNETKLTLGKDFQAMSAGGNGNATGELVFAGYGISAPNLGYDDYENIDVEGKIVVIIRREPQQDDENSKFDGKRTSTHSFIRTKLLRAAERKAAGVLLVNDPFSTKDGDVLSPANGFGGASKKVPLAHLKQDVLNQILATTPVKTRDGKELKSIEQIAQAIDESFQPLSMPLAGWKATYRAKFENQQTKVMNVVGVLEGEGPLADETVIIGAHYDHLGYGGFGSRRPGVRAVHNGADDNASGTAALLELARLFAAREKPLPRRLVLIAFTAEERGLVGSRYYVDHPLFPLESTAAMINFDMIGNVRDGKLLVYGVGTAKAFRPLIEPAAEGTGLTIDAKAGVLAASDHWPFFQKKVPSFHIFSGMTDIYHTPDDDFETLNVEGVVQAVEFTEKLATEIAKLPESTEFVQTGRQSMPRSRRGITNFGFLPDYAARVKGVQVGQVRDGSIAAKAGLKAGDIIIAIGGQNVDEPPAMIRALRNADRSKPLKVKIKRGGTEIELEFKPAAG